MRVKLGKKKGLLCGLLIIFVLSAIVCFMVGCTKSVETGKYKRKVNDNYLDNSYIRIINNSKCRFYNILDEDGEVLDSYNNENDSDTAYEYKYYDKGKKVEVTVWESESKNKKETWSGSYKDGEIKFLKQTYKIGK